MDGGERDRGRLRPLRRLRRRRRVELRGYRAGTNPFDASDRLRITAYAAPQDADHALSFEYVGGHVYGVSTTLSLTNPQWTAQKAKKTETDAEQEQVMPSADEDDVGVATIYVVPAEGATSQFFRLEAK